VHHEQTEEAMLTLADCVAFCGLNEDEIDAIAEHEKVPEIVAAEIGAELLKTPKGIFEIKGFILDNLEKAKLSGQVAKAKHLDRVYARFHAAYPTPRVF
jgi:hypothetical protein